MTVFPLPDGDLITVHTISEMRLVEMHSMKVRTITACGAEEYIIQK